MDPEDFDLETDIENEKIDNYNIFTSECISEFTDFFLDLSDKLPYIIPPKKITSILYNLNNFLLNQNDYNCNYNNILIKEEFCINYIIKNLNTIIEHNKKLYNVKKNIKITYIDAKKIFN